MEQDPTHAPATSAPGAATTTVLGTGTSSTATPPADDEDATTTTLGGTSAAGRHSITGRSTDAVGTPPSAGHTVSTGAGPDGNAAHTADAGSDGTAAHAADGIGANPDTHAAGPDPVLAPAVTPPAAEATASGPTGPTGSTPPPAVTPAASTASASGPRDTDGAVPDEGADPDDGPATPTFPAPTGTTTTGTTPASTPVPLVDRHRLAQGRLGIDEVTPEVSGGRFASKAVVGEVVPVTASVWREGHDAVAATLVWQRCTEASHANVESLTEPCGGADPRSTRMVSAGPETDRFVSHLVPDGEGLWSFRIDAWSDPWATWRHAVEVKAAAGQGPAELANDLEAGARLLERGARQIEKRHTPTATSTGPADTGVDDSASRTAPITLPPALALAASLYKAATTLRDTSLGLPERMARALSEPVHRTMVEQPVRELVTEGRTHHVFVERSLALSGSWYEFFPRSTGGVDDEGRPVHGTWATATRELDRVAAMGFDVAYLPPIHPVGAVNRKGPNNTLTPGPDDVGSPWAIGSAAGGHDAVDPLLGTMDEFDGFVARAGELGLDVALDLALQCAPDHPWAQAHPEWFVVRPDGTIAYAENPPKKYQDIYPVNFDTDPDGIYAEVLRVVLLWMEHGVRVFRVDNPHTKPPNFWAWLIAEVHRRDPGVVFLAEAFTRPARLYGLAKAGFSQSYTYFTWRTGKQELAEFFTEHRDRIDECRPNCFVNTPDILHESLQVGGPGMFALRAALAATLAPSWGVYAGFELFEHQAVKPGSEEYLDSEKYQLRPRDFAGALAEGRSLEPWITRLNQLRREHPALRQLRTLRFHEVDNDALLAYSKTDPVTGDVVLCVVTLNPYAAEEGMLRLDMSALGLDDYARFGAFDEVSGQTFDWGQTNFVRLEPWRDVAHIVSIVRR